MFTSKIIGPLIDDRNFMSHAADFMQGGETRLRGHVPRDYSAQPFGALSFAKPFDIPEIPRGDWTPMIEEMERTETTLWHIRKKRKVGVLDQNGTNYCWCNGVVQAIKIVRAMNGLPLLNLSPASVAAPIKGFRNQGGWGGDALEWIIEHGINTVEEWPANAINRSYYTEANKALALARRVLEWYELRPRSFGQLMTCTLLRIPVAIGLNWWRHEVCAVRPVVLGRDAFGIGIDNSWSESYGEDGHATLSESKATPDDAVAPLVPSAVEK